MTLEDTTSVNHIQPVRRVYENEQPNSGSTTTDIIHLTCHPDPSTGKDILLWDDILAAFKDEVVHVRSGIRVLPFLKGPDFKNLDPLRIAAVPGVTLYVVVRGQLSTTKEMSVESLQRALPDMPPQDSNTSSTLVSDTSTRAAITVRRNPVGGLVEEAMQNYNHIDNPAMLPPRQGPQAILDERAPKENDTDIQKPPTTTISSDINNSDLRPGAPQELSSASAPDFAVVMMKARLGDKDAQYAVGDSYYFGRGVQQDYQTAADWYLKAAEQGHADAQNDIGYLYQHGRGVPKNYSRAMEWYQKAAEQKDTNAYNNIGSLYRWGFGVTQNFSKAMEWYQKAAEQGHMAAHSNIGSMYHKGLGVPMDYSQAMEWYRKAADQGSVIAQFNTGWLYEHGEGVPKDRAKAMEWFKKAADGGYVEAKEWLYELERQGDDSVGRVSGGGAGKKKRGFLNRIFN